MSSAPQLAGAETGTKRARRPWCADKLCQPKKEKKKSEKSEPWYIRQKNKF
jgi:hypothetical protein